MNIGSNWVRSIFSWLNRHLSNFERRTLFTRMHFNRSTTMILFMNRNVSFSQHRVLLSMTVIILFIHKTMATSNKVEYAQTQLKSEWKKKSCTSITLNHCVWNNKKNCQTITKVWLKESKIAVKTIESFSSMLAYNISAFFIELLHKARV